jgi:hypothetical protein
VIVLLPTAYFPPVSYFVHLANCDRVFIEQMETYPKQTYRNRCEIMTSAGKLSLVVPVSKPFGNHTLTKDVEISYREPWNQHHWKSITTAYRSSPYFTFYSDLFQPLFESRETSLLKLNREILDLVCKIVKLDVTIENTTDYIKAPEGILDLRKEMTPKKQHNGINFPEYPQVFSHISGFEADLSILDLLFNMGPETGRYLKSVRE